MYSNNIPSVETPLKDTKMTDPFNPQSFPLHDFARDGKNLLVKELSQTEPSSILSKDGDGRTPLFWASSSSNAEGLSILLKKIKETPELLKKFDIDDTDSGGWTLLHIASSTGSVAIIDLLEPFEPDVDIQTAAGQTALHFAVSKGNIDVVRKLITSPFNASVRIKDKRGQVPLHRAAAIGSLPITKALVEEGKSPINTSDFTGWTPLYHALAEGHGDVAVYLINHGADLEREDSEGKNPLDVSLDSKTREFVEAALQNQLR